MSLMVRNKFQTIVSVQKSFLSSNKEGLTLIATNERKNKSFLLIATNSNKWNTDGSHYWEVVHKKVLCFLSFVAINVRPSLFHDKKLFWTETIVWNLFRILKHIGIKPKSIFSKKNSKNFQLFWPPKIGIQQAIWCLFHEDFHFKQCYTGQFVSKSLEKNFLLFLKHQCLHR